MSDPGKKPLSELTDAELAQELLRRRRARGYKGPQTSAPSRSGARRSGTPGWKVRAWLKDLGLGPKATRQEVEGAWARLSAKYDPSKYENNPDKHRDATRLVAGLRDAYLSLVEHFMAHERDGDAG